MRHIGMPGPSEYPREDRGGPDEGSGHEPLLYDDAGFPLYHSACDAEVAVECNAAPEPELLPIFGVSETLPESVATEIRAEHGGTRAETPYGRAKYPSRSLDVVVGKDGTVIEIRDVAEMFSRATFGNIEVLRESALSPPLKLTTISLGSAYEHPTHVMLEGLFQLDLDNSREASLGALNVFSESFANSDETSDGGYFFTRLARHQVRQEDMVWEAYNPDPLGGGHWVLPHDIRFDQPSTKDPVICEPDATIFEAFHGGEIQGVMPNKFVVWVDWSEGMVRVLNHAVAGGETLVRPRDVAGIPHYSSENGIYYQGDSFGALDYYMKNFTSVYLRVFDALQRAGHGPSGRPPQPLKLAMGGTHLQRGPLHNKGDIDMALNQPGRLNQPWRPKALNRYSVN